MTNDNRDFDRMMKSILEDGAEQVDGSIWEGVSARMSAITAAAAARRRRRDFFIAVSGMAAAAALALMLPWSAPDTGVTGGQGMVARAEVAEQTAVPPDEIIRETAQAETVTTEEKSEIITPSGGVHNSDGTVKEDMTLLADIPEATDVPEATDIPETEADSFGHEERTTPEEIVNDAFRLMEIEDMRQGAKRRMGIKAGGSVMTNGNPSSLSGRYMSRFSESVPGEPTISQTSKDSRYSIPISAGVALEIPLKGRWSLETGLSYTFLERTFTGVYSETGQQDPLSVNADIRHSLHYLGIPLNIRYEMISGKRAIVQAFGGVKGEKALSERFLVPYSSKDISLQRTPDGFQASVAAGFSINFMLGRHAGIYFDPGIQYFFDCGEPVSIRTQQPLQMSLELGVKFKL